MVNSIKRKLLWGSVWTIGGFGISQVMRLATNIVLTRLLAPEVFGIMTIVNSLRTGFELLSDVGISQNIVQSRSGAEPDFFNTAWTIQLIRGLLLWLASIIAAPLIAKFYGIPVLGAIFPVIGLIFVIVGLGSTSVFLLQKQMLVAKRNAFDVFFEFVSAVAHIVAALLNPTIWALVFGGIFAAAMRAVGTHFLIRGVRNRIHFSRKHLGEILGFGKWVFIASLIYFMSGYIDRLYFGSAIPLAMLGVYGIARTLADAASMLASRLMNLIVFPYVSSAKDFPRSELREKIGKIRFRMILLAAVGAASVASSSEFIVQLLYDSRYWDAAWMLPLLCIGSWFAIVSNLNESALLGFGKPMYSAMANTAKLGFLIFGLPLALGSYGMIGAVTVIMLSELVRYVPVVIGARREHFGFVFQDLAATVMMLMTIGVLDVVRWTLDISTITSGLGGPSW